MDARLLLCGDMVPPCNLVADIGTDHGRLPVWLLETGRCRQAILSDISPLALAHARDLVHRRGLEDRATLTVADGFDCLTRPADWVTVTGMGGRLIASMLHTGQGKLGNAGLVLSAHTDLPLVRRALSETGYRICREEICFCGGRYYVVWQACRGSQTLTEDELELGTPLLTAADPAVLRGWLERRRDILHQQLEGLLLRAELPEERIGTLRRQIALLEERMKRK